MLDAQFSATYGYDENIASSVIVDMIAARQMFVVIMCDPPSRRFVPKRDGILP